MSPVTVVHTAFGGRRKASGRQGWAACQRFLHLHKEQGYPDEAHGRLLQWGVVSPLDFSGSVETLGSVFIFFFFFSSLVCSPHWPGHWGKTTFCYVLFFLLADLGPLCDFFLVQVFLPLRVQQASG